MYIETLKFNIDWKRHTLHVYHEDGNAQKIVIDDEGDGELEVEMFKLSTLGGNLKRFIEALSEILSKDQLESILMLWGTSNAIKALNMTAVLEGDKILTKKVIGLGLLRKIITGGVNSTYKVINKEEQKTMKEHAERMGKGIRKEPETLIETEARMRKEGKFEKIEGQGAPNISKEESSSVEVIADEPQLSEQEMRKEVARLQKQIDDDKGWNENETPWTVRDRIHLIQKQLKGIELQKEAIRYKKEVNSLSGSKSIGTITSQPIKMSQHKNTSSQSALILPKKKPLNAVTPVAKKRS